MDYKKGKQNLQRLKELIEKHNITSAIEKVISLEETPEMLKNLVENRPQGKVVIQID